MRRRRLLQALRGEATDTTPVWLMRQAGRHLPGYRELRRNHSLLDIVRDPELAAQVTLEPVRRYDVDAGIVFADITLPFLGMDVPFSLDAGVGPVVRTPLRSRADVEKLRPLDARSSLPFVGRTIERFLELEADRPIIGFAGAPFTLAAYLVDGGPSKEHTATKRFLYSDGEGFDRLLDRLAEATIDYLTLQARSGAEALQLFDTWVGTLSERQFVRHALEPLRRIFEAVRPLGRPTIYFSTGSSHLWEAIARTGADAIGVDWREPLSHVRRRVGERLALQGNLDPAALLAAPERLREEADTVLGDLPDRRGHVFNLGHGVLPETDPEQVRLLVDHVHRSGSDRRVR